MALLSSSRALAYSSRIAFRRSARPDFSGALSSAGSWATNTAARTAPASKRDIGDSSGVGHRRPADGRELPCPAYEVHAGRPAGDDATHPHHSGALISPP